MHKVIRTKDIPNPDQAWSYVRDFGSTWHPDISANRIEVDASGAIVRSFQDHNGGSYREQLTYFSDSDRVLRYALTEGIDGVEDYRGEACAATSTVSWSASFNATGVTGSAVETGTGEIFDNGLNWLAENSQAVINTSAKTPEPQLLITGLQLRQLKINATPQLSILSAMTSDQSCWTLVLFLHGIGGNATNWQAQLDVIGQTHCVAALDLRGYGESQLGNVQTTIDDYCDDILSAMKHVGARRLVLVGLSMGSWIATSFAMRHPQLLAGLVLAGGCTGMSEADAQERNNFHQSRAVPISTGKTPAEFADGVVEIIAGPQANAAQRLALHKSMSAISSETYLDALTCFCNPCERFDYARIACPVLLVTGEHDRLAPPAKIRQVSLNMFDAIYNDERLPDIRFEVIADAGHLCNLERPDEFNTQLIEFLDRMPGTAIRQMPSRESKKQLKSRRILDAALQEFSALGFDGVSMSAIAKRAGVSKPTLYHYFGDKDGLFTTVLQEGCDHIITPLSAPDGTLVDRLWNFSWNYADFVLREDMLSLARLVLGEASRRPEVAGTYHSAGPGKALQGLVTFIQECVDAEQLDVDDIEYAAQDLWSLILSGPRDYYLHFVNDRPNRTHLLRSIGHGLQVFLKIYSTDSTKDLEALALKIAAMESASKNNRRWTKA